MAIVMNMSGYEIERREAPVEEYGEEVMYSGWNPQLALVRERTIEQMDGHGLLLPSLANVDLEDFLRKMYVTQR